MDIINFKKINYVGFDFDNTLVDENYSIRSRWEIVLENYSDLSPKLRETFFKILQKKGLKYKFHLNEALKELNLDQGLIKKMVAEFLKTRGKELLLPGSVELLEFLKNKKIKIGIITNGKKTYQEARIRKAGIENLLDFAYYGNNYQKPDPKFFQECLKLFKVRRFQEFLYVGDDYLEDIESPRSLGIRTCWISSQGFSKEDETLKFSSLLELLELFKKVYK